MDILEQLIGADIPLFLELSYRDMKVSFDEGICLEFILQLRILPENYRDLKPFEGSSKYSDTDDFGFLYDELPMI